jgi:hypothetical protein
MKIKTPLARYKQFVANERCSTGTYSRALSGLGAREIPRDQAGAKAPVGVS